VRPLGSSAVQVLVGCLRRCVLGSAQWLPVRAAHAEGLAEPIASCMTAGPTPTRRGYGEFIAGAR